MENRASKSFTNAAVEFENIERILLYLRVSNSLINEDKLKSLNKLRFFNNKLEIPMGLTQIKKRNSWK